MSVLVAALLLFVQTSASASAKVWTGREAEFEDCLRTAKVLKVEAVPIGVTKPMRAFTEPGSICESFAWKALRPGMHKGFWDSYKSEIAAYELDKMVGLGMIPPIVERDVDRERGAAVLWLNGVHSWEEALRRPKASSWTRNVVRMKMWDNLVGNTDRNKGNILADETGELFLIDHSRAFISDKKLPAALEAYVDRELWEKMQALTFESLKERIGKWVGNGEIRAMLARRDRMKKDIDAIVAARGDHAYVR
jgi:hypothetical protein